jgi:Flp pilus assembly protein TadB
MALPFIGAALALAEIAPSIAKWIGGTGAEETAREVLDVAHKIAGTKETNDAVSVLKRDPKLLLEFQTKLFEIEEREADRILQDRMDARARDMAYAAAGRNNTRADVMVVSAACGMVFCLIALGYYREDLPGEAVGIISTIAGIFGSCLKDAYAFEFGSSRGSKVKDERVTAALLGRQ